jgi:hypothetical protein
MMPVPNGYRQTSRTVAVDVLVPSSEIHHEERTEHIAMLVVFEGYGGAATIGLPLEGLL